MKKIYLPFLLLLTFASPVFMSGCEEETDPVPNDPPKVAFSVTEADFQPVDLNKVTAPAITGTVQSDAGLREVTIELLKGSETVVLQSESAFDEVNGKIFVFNLTPEYTAEVTGFRVKAVDVQDRTVEKTLSISVVEKIPELVFSPVDGLAGTTITLSGFNFTGAQSVMIGETAIESFTVADDGSSISFVLPEDVESGLISVIPAEGEAMVSKSAFTVIVKPKVIVTHPDVIVNAQANRHTAGVATAFSAEGIPFTLAQGADEAVSQNIDFISVDSGGDNKLDLFSPAHDGWLPNNYFKKDEPGDVTWPVLNQTKMVLLADKDEAFFNAITAEELQAMMLGDEPSTRIALDYEGAGAIILFETQDGKKGLLHYKAHEPNATVGSKADIFTFDIKVLEEQE